MLPDPVHDPTLPQTNPLNLRENVHMLCKLECSLGVTDATTIATTFSKHSLDQDDTPSKRRRTVKKAVRFCEDRNTVKLRSAFNEEELQAVWLQPEEYQDIKLQVKTTLRAVKRQVQGEQMLDFAVHCLHGLERHIAYVIFCRGPVTKARKIVLEILYEQKLQRATNSGAVSDPSTSLNAVSMILTRDCRIEALQRGSPQIYC